jgi:SpoVK/Ycf46/Vps4 family AAA+-type ATPase
VRALFSLASRLAPCVIFIDEVDSVLASRDRPDEHGAVRELKNEFMLHWDGMRTGACERVIVLAATNRPFDLDEAVSHTPLAAALAAALCLHPRLHLTPPAYPPQVLRRLPRRVMVPLPCLEARIALLRLHLADQPLAPGFDLAEVARRAEGYSGSDIKALCTRAAMGPVRELLTREKNDGHAASVSPAAAAIATAAARPAKRGALAAAATPPGGVAAAAAADGTPRPLRVSDFFAKARGEELVVAASVSASSHATAELTRWHAEYGEGGKKAAARLSYYT